MKVSTEEIEHCQVIVDVEVDDQRLEKAMDQAYRRLVGRLNIPGFRKGKAPRALVERVVGRESLLEEAIELLVPVVYQEVIHAQGLKPSAQPRLEVTSAAPLQFKATVPLQPKVVLGDYRSIRLTPEPTDVSEEEVDEVIQRLREAHAEWVPVDRAVQCGDRVALDVHASVGERTLLDSRDAEYIVDPAGAQPAPGFAEQIVGLSADEERSFTLRLPDSLQEKELAGHEAVFRVKVHWVKERHLPDLDDAFASTVGSFERVDDLRRAIADDLRRRKQAASRQALEDNAIRAVIEASQLDYPPQLVEEQAERLEKQLERNLDRQGMTIQQYMRLTNQHEADFRAELRSQAENAVKRSVVLDALAAAEGVEVTEAEIRDEIRSLVADSPDADRLARDAFARPETREQVRSVLRHRKAVHRLVEIVAPSSPEAAAPQEKHGETHEQPV